MKKVILGNSDKMHTLSSSQVIMGCMRISEMTQQALNHFIHKAMELGINTFDHADIYGGGMSEELFGKVLKEDKSIRREDMIIQSKCGIKSGMYDLSKQYIIQSVDGILKRLNVEYLDILLLHRPDALVEPEEVASAFDELLDKGKVLKFGVSNHKPMQIELLKKYLNQNLLINQLQFSIPVSNMVANGLEVNMTSEGSIDRDSSVLDYCRLNDMVIQAWSPFQKPQWQGTFIDNGYDELNWCLGEIAAKYNTTKTAIATAWILRHPAKMQVIAGTTNEDRLSQIASGSEIILTRDEWYKIYLSSGHILP